MAQLAVSVAGAVVGGAIGFMVAGPAGVIQGAELGFMLGGIAGSLLIHQRGPTPGDLRVQDSAYGKPIPLYYGLYRGTGNVIWCGQPVEQSSGKGSPPSQAKVSLSFAVALCKGPIAGIRRIWANGKLIYDMSNPSNFQAVSGSNQMVTNWAVYLGDENQLPDPTIQAAQGVANTPPFRGLAYVVFNDLDLSQWGNYIPSLTFEVFKTATVQYSQNTTYANAIYPAFSTNYNNIATSVDSGGTVNGWQYALVGSFLQAVRFRASATGATEFLMPGTLHLGTDFPVIAFQNMDSDNGLLTSGGNYYDQNGALFATGGYSANYGSPSNGNAIKRNNRIYIANRLALFSHPINIWDLNYQSVTSGNLSGIFSIVGVSDSFIYVVAGAADPTYPHSLLKFDLNGNFIAVLATNAALDYTATGYLVSDAEIYIYQAGNGIYLWNGSTLTKTPIPATNPNAVTCLYVANGTAYLCFPTVNGLTFCAVVPSLNPASQAVGDIVTDICTRAGLTSAQFDVSTLTDQCLGYAVANHSSPRANLAPLQSAFFFDANDTDGKLKFVRRGTLPVGTFYYADLGSSAELGSDNNTTPITETIVQEVDLPRTLVLTYSSFGTDCQENTQRAFHPDTNSNKDATAQATIVFADSDAQARTQSMLWSAWAGRKTFTFSTPLSYMQYEPGDVVNLQGANGQLYVVRITRSVYDGQGSLQWEAQSEEADIYPNGSFAAAGGRARGYTTPSIDYSGPTVLRVLDIPPLRDTDNTPGLYLAGGGYASNWPGAMVDVSRDGSTYSQLQRIVAASAVGFANNALGDFAGGNVPDEINSLTVQLYSGLLSSISYANFLNGNNAAYVGGEVIFFRNATLIATNTYVLTGLLRGRAGTDFATATHAVGDQFVFLDPNALVRVSINQTDLSGTMYFEPHLLNLFANQPVSPTTVQPRDACVKPIKPHLFRANQGSSVATTDITLAWFRRARVYYEWVSGADVPLDQQTEAYTLTISNSSGVVKRTVTVTAATSYVYSAANITADGFASGNTINFSVSQNSDLGVTGFAATTSITR